MIAPLSSPLLLLVINVVSVEIVANGEVTEELVVNEMDVDVP